MFDLQEIQRRVADVFQHVGEILLALLIAKTILG